MHAPILAEARKLTGPKELPDLSEWKDLGAIMDAIYSAFEATDRDSLLEPASNAETD
jgi:hypothetical protein